MRAYLVLQDASGWHRSVPRADVDLRPDEVVVDEADDYFEACKLADKLNQVAEVQDG